MSEIIEIKEGDLVLARHIPASAAWKDGLNFFSQDEDYIQVGLWGYGAGKELKALTKLLSGMRSVASSLVSLNIAARAAALSSRAIVIS